MDKKRMLEKVDWQFQQQINIKYAFKEKKRIKEIGFDKLERVVEGIKRDYVQEALCFDKAKKAYVSSFPEDETKEFMNLNKFLNDIKVENLNTIALLKENLIAKEENSQVYLQYFGDICRYCDEYEMAEDIYLFQIDQEITDGFIGLGLTYNRTHDYITAHKCFMYGCLLENKKAAYHAGYLYYEMAQIEQAERWFKKAIKDNADVDALAELADLYQNNGKPEKGRQLYKIAEKLIFEEEALTCEEELLWQKMSRKKQ
ncbi:tetratricopeptide repeat protein [Liquorilactobacillus aquaticus]|nr:hypothetical protein [Liquorilactobacillus aquaticus]